MAEAFRQAQLLTEHSRLHNRARLARKANANDIVVGDSVIVAANEPVSLSAKWDPQYEVTKVHGTTYWVRHQRTLKEIKVHRDKLRLVDPNMGWDEVAPSPRRRHRRMPNAPLPHVAQPDEDRPPPHGAGLVPPAVPNVPLVHAPVPQALNPAGELPPHPIALPPTPPPGGGGPPTPPPGGGHTPPQPMDVEPPHFPYFLRKRAAPTITLCPDRAKRLRIDCLAFAQTFLRHLPSAPTGRHVVDAPPSGTCPE